jgi:hypothetical protein
VVSACEFPAAAALSINAKIAEEDAQEDGWFDISIGLSIFPVVLDKDFRSCARARAARFGFSVSTF